MREAPGMRFVVYGAGAIGGVVGGRLQQYGHDVTLIARGLHLAAIRSDGLVLRDPIGEVTLRISAIEDPGEIAWEPDDVVLVAVKSQHSEQVLRKLAAAVPFDVSVVCVQNGVRNEVEALRRFPDVYGVPVFCPAVHLEPGVVEANSAPVTGVLDVGRYPAGTDDTAAAIAEAFSKSTFLSAPISDVTRWKWRKLLMNLGNAIEMLCGGAARRGQIFVRAVAEGEACLAAAGIDMVTVDEVRARRTGNVTIDAVAGRTRPGSSSWQSLVRRAPDSEIDYLNGEIVLLGRLYGVPTPVNALLQRAANQAVCRGCPPESMAPDKLLAMFGDANPG
jgi:2-dehydropantoate 2-reductase